MPSDEVIVSVRVPKSLSDGIDEIAREWGISNRSVLVRMALASFVEEHAAVRLPHAECHTEEEGVDSSVERRPFAYRRKRLSPSKIRRKAKRRAHERRD